MRRWWYFAIMGLAVALWVLPSMVFAQTYAYIPKSVDLDNAAVVRIDTDDLETDEIPLSGCASPYGAAVAPDGTYVLVTCRDSDRLYKISNTHFDGIGSPVYRDVGTDPMGIAIDSPGRYGYVANNSDDTVTEILLSSLTESDTIAEGNGPSAVAAFYDATADETIVYVANQGDTMISVIRDGITEIPIEVDGYPEGLALSPSGDLLYAAVNHPFSGITALAFGELVVISTSNQTIIQRKTIGRNLWGVAVGSDGANVYITWNLDDDRGRVALYYPASDIVRQIDSGEMDRLNIMSVRGVAAPKYGDFAYVISSANNAVFHIDALNLTIEPVLTTAEDISPTAGVFIGGTPPSTPSGLTATAENYNKIQLAWTDNASDELGYKIERREEGEDTYAHIATTEADTTEYLDTGLMGDTTYEYRIQAFNETADSTYAVLAQAVTTPVGSFSWCFIGTLLQ